MFSFDAPENIRKPDIFYPLMKCQVFKMNQSQESEGNICKKKGLRTLTLQNCPERILYAATRGVL